MHITELKKKKFHYICTLKNGLEIYAGYTRYKDNIQYYYVKDNITLGNVMVTSAENIKLFHTMYEVLKNEEY